jgi:hypothetical protein
VNVRDLVVLVADKDMEQTMLALLDRSASLGISPITYRVLTHPNRDNGCRTASHELLRSQSTQHRFALVMFDREGCGGDALTREALERQVEAQLAANGWADRSCALVLDPELEIWLWTDSPALAPAIGWDLQPAAVRDWLRAKRFAIPDNGKPARPKEALRTALRHVSKPPSASLFKELASKASLSRCTDPAFAKLKATLQGWFA